MADKKTVLITGANTGLGYHTVRTLCDSEREYHILLGGRRIEKSKEASEEVQAEFPDTRSTIQPVQIDIEDDDSIDALYNELESKDETLDILVNNAGTTYHLFMPIFMKIVF
jgi:NAD(P)-dependent dehydrogenase (short-subunit alcohol dehydrogenase family)